MRIPTPLHAVLLPLFVSCSALGPGQRMIDTERGDVVDLVTLANRIADADVVFLGEEHDNDTAHELQYALTRLLHERREHVAISLEMFERDVQPRLDLYLAGVIDEANFLEHARPWPNYPEHYRPGVEYARENGLAVLAANCPRPLASRVSKRGLLSVAGDPWTAAQVDDFDGEYRDRINELMGTHGNNLEEADRRRFFGAQCVKDDTMAESIANYMAANADDSPLVVHWCGRFHSDHRLGTVERLASRMPHLKIVVISTVSTGNVGRDITKDEAGMADYIWLVPEM